MLNRKFIYIIIFMCVFTVAQNGCAPKKKPSNQQAAGKRYKLAKDEGPLPHEPPDISKIPNAKPVPVAKSKIGNPKSYTVFKKKYSVLPSSKGYKERGKASWYGKKFHGYKTSNGETYDMYAMSAAHKTLPLPTFARIKNLENGRSIIVKINDRGPFHEDRIIDLSYAAASKLGILAKGTGHVEIEAIDPSMTQPKQYLQVAAFKNEANAKKLALELQNMDLDHPIEIRPHQATQSKLYLVHIGPIKDETVVSQLRNKLSANKLPKPISVHLE